MWKTAWIVQTYLWKPKYLVLVAGTAIGTGGTKELHVNGQIVRRKTLLFVSLPGMPLTRWRSSGKAKWFTWGMYKRQPTPCLSSYLQHYRNSITRSLDQISLSSVNLSHLFLVFDRLEGRRIWHVRKAIWCWNIPPESGKVCTRDFVNQRVRVEGIGRTVDIPPTTSKTHPSLRKESNS